MRKEKIKTFILLFLICSATALAANVWFGNGIWPKGYDFFVTLPSRTFFSQLFKKEQPYISPMENLGKPQKLVVTNGERRSVYYNSDASYAPYYAAISDFFATVLCDESLVFQTSTVPQTEWYGVLRNDELLDSKSIYISYSTAFSPRLFAEVTGAGRTWLENGSIALQEFILTPIEKMGQDVLLYVRDAQSGTITKYHINYPHKASLYDRIDAMQAETDNYSFAFELNLHDSQVGIGGGVSQKIVMDPLLLILPSETRSFTISGENPIGGQADTEALLSVFGYRERSVNHHTGADGKEHYVENYGSLSIGTDGLVEYIAVDEEKGVPILPNAEAEATLYDSLNGAVGFAARVWQSLVPDQPFEALISSDLVENADADYAFTLDYYYEGTPIAMQTPHMRHGVEIRVKKGKIIEYRHLLRRFSGVGVATETPSMLQAIDGMYSLLDAKEEKIRIEDLFLSYIEDTAPGEKSPVWCARIAGQSEPVFYR